MILSNGMNVNVLAIDFEHGNVDYKVTNRDYKGACTVNCPGITLETAETVVKAALEGELVI